MLVLSRRENDFVRLIYGDLVIDVMITGVKGSNVKIGITAPREVHIIRGELITEETAQPESRPPVRS